MPRGLHEKSHTPRTRRWRGTRLRIARIHADDLGPTLAQLDPSLIVLDIEPVVVAWGEGPDTLDSRYAALAAGPLGNRPTVLCTNSSRFGAAGQVRLVSAARKPWTPLHRLGPRGARPLVIGDLLAVDGLLAWRLKADFIWVAPTVRPPVWPRILAAADGALMRIATVACSDKEIR